jgi:NAD(P)-dependent dehydrogenase (short-subunit alcohol dehydrogenase family)
VSCRRGRRPAINGSVVAITGAARGIGLATALRFSQLGAHVAIGDTDRAALDAVQAKSPVSTFDLDVTSERSFADFIANVEARLGTIDILINNAGIMPVGPLQGYSDEMCSHTVDVDLLGVIRGCRMVAPGMVQRRAGHIINVASVAGRFGAPGLTLYCAAKYGVVGFTEALGAELKPSGVHVAAVLPSFTSTGLIDGLHQHRLVTPVRPEQIAEAIVRTVATRRPTTVVPTGLGPASAMVSALPARLKRWLMTRRSYARIFLEPDWAQRRDYMQRSMTRTTSPAVSPVPCDRPA